MHKINELELGSNDAENYKRSDSKELFNEIFLKDQNLEKLLQSNIFFLIGEKGTGKTAYAVFLANNEYKNTRSQIKFIRETQYQKFVKMKQQKNLDLSDYSAIWRVIFLVLVAMNIKDSDIKSSFSKNAKLKAIKSAIDSYYHNAFSPEISTVLQMVDNTKIAAELISKVASVGMENSASTTFSETQLQTNLLFIERKLIDSLQDLKLEFNQFLFIDGIDIRPSGIEYKEYLSCIKGLMDAVWSLNNDTFSQSNGSKGKVKIVALVRPDIFQEVGLQNSTNKIINNSVFLDWRTTYTEYPTSNLFKLADRLLTYNQDEKYEAENVGRFFNYYFNWEGETRIESRGPDTPFVEFLRLSYSRPRDIVTIIQTMKNIQIQKKESMEHFSRNVFKSHEFNNAFSEYLMGGIKDHLAFYYTEDDYQLLLHFISLFKDNATFSYDFYCENYDRFCNYVLEKAKDLPEFIEEKDRFLQFLYDTNIICYIEPGPREPLYRWCYRERNLANMAPKVKIGQEYRFHYGLLKALNLGPY